MKTTDERLNNIEGEIFIRSSYTNPNLLIRRFEKIESFTEFDLEKQPVLNAYELILSNVKERDFKIIQDIKLVKLYSLTCNLVWYNNALKSYDGNHINFEPLISLMKKKNRYYYLCTLKLHQTKLEFGNEVETLFKYVIGSAYNSMIDSQDLGFTMGDPKMMVKEHSVKVEEVNQLFKELSNKVNHTLTHKFSNALIDTFSNLKFSI